MSPLRFWLTILSTAMLSYLLIYALTGLPVVSAVPAVVLATLPRAYLVRRRAERLARVQEAWPDGIRDILASVRSGASLPNAIEDLSLFGPEPLRDAFQGFAVYARSLGVVKALEMVKQDLADPTSDRVVEVLILAYERGGRVVPEILEDLAEATTRDLWTMEQVRTEALEQKINARVVFAMPWIVLVIVTSRSGAFRDFYSTTAGISVVIAGGVMSLLGILIASRLGGQPTEPRVFAGRVP
ncbi:MAG: type II secretion system F family protein [Acidimicrobiia bacterium]